MPVLSNPKHERFAQELAKGKTADEAYQLAGYRANRGNAATLKAKQSVSDRVQEIAERVAMRVEVSLSSVTEALLRIADKAEALGDAPGLSVARASRVDVAKLHGLVIDKVKVDQTVRDERELDDSELAHIARSGSDGTATPPARPN